MRLSAGTEAAPSRPASGALGSGCEHPCRRGSCRLEDPRVKAVHMVLGIAATALTGGAGLLGAWCWWRVRSTQWFWRLLRVGQAAVIVQVLWGGLLVITGHKAPSLHY